MHPEVLPDEKSLPVPDMVLRQCFAASEEDGSERIRPCLGQQRSPAYLHSWPRHFCWRPLINVPYQCPLSVTFRMAPLLIPPCWREEV